ncbi:Tkl protein kinase [Globisporangium polare]
MAALRESTSEDDLGSSSGDAPENDASPVDDHSMSSPAEIDIDMRQQGDTERESEIEDKPHPAMHQDLRAEDQFSTGSPVLQAHVVSQEQPADQTPSVSGPEDQHASNLEESLNVTAVQSPHNSDSTSDQPTEKIDNDSSGKPDQEPEPTSRDPLSVASATIDKFRYVTLEGSRKRVVQFQVEFRLANDETLTVWKRFSAFRNCWQGIRDRDGAQVASSLPFPSRFALFGNLSRVTVKQRQNELNSFLTKVFVSSSTIPIGVLMSDGASYFKTGAESDVLL